MPNPSENPTILVIEDDPSIHAILQDILEMLGYNPIVLASMTEVFVYLSELDEANLPVAAIVDGNITQDRIVTPEESEQYKFQDGERVRDLLLGINPYILLIGNSASGSIPGITINIEKSPNTLTLLEQILAKNLGPHQE